MDMRGNVQWSSAIFLPRKTGQKSPFLIGCLQHGFHFPAQVATTHRRERRITHAKIIRNDLQINFFWGIVVLGIPWYILVDANDIA